MTARRPRLLSQGTSRHSGVGPETAGSPVIGSLLARWPGALAAMNMHSWPTAWGCHSKGPTSVCAPGTRLAMVRDVVVIGDQSSGQTNPAEGRQCQPLTVTLS